MNPTFEGGVEQRVKCFSGSFAMAYAFPSQDDQTVGARSLQFRKRANLWTRMDLTAVDGVIETSPPDAIKYDRRIEAFVSGGADTIIAPNISVRTNIKAFWMLNKKEEKDPPKSPIEKSISVFEPSIVGTFINPKGLEMFGGFAYRSVGSYTENQISETASSSTKFEAVNLLVPRFGVVRRTGIWDGGLYFVMGREVDRGFSKSASDGSTSSGVDPVFMATEFGLVGGFQLGIMQVELDLAMVQASEGGQKSADGVGIKDDFLRVKASSLWPAPGGSMQVKVGYNTLSYSSNSFISIDTIPVFSTQIIYLQGNRDAHVFYGAIFGYANDGQSIPEFNATYKFTGIGLTTGIFIPI